MHPLDRRAYAVITSAWALAILLVNPSGNFPLVDDWSFAWAVRSLVAEGEWRLHDWTSMTLATQAIWGALFAQLFGFSFNTLRASTLVLAWLATVGVYAVMRQCGARRDSALLLAAATALCPMFFSLSFTFMTDVPAAAVAVWALLYAVRYLETHRRSDLVISVALLTATILIRQTAAALAVGYAAAILFATPGRKGLAAAAFACVVPIGALALYNGFLEASHRPALYGGNEQEVVRVLTAAPLEAAKRVRVLGAIFYLYFGFLLLAVGSLIRPPSSVRARLAVIAVFAASLVYLPLRGRTLPLLGGNLYDVALYPLTMPRNDLWPHAPRELWFALTIAALSASALIAFALLRGLNTIWRNTRVLQHRVATVVLCGVAMVGYLAPYTLVHAFDRYLIVPLILLMMLLTSAGEFHDRAPRPAVAAAAVMLLALAAFDIAATRDFFAFSRARWAALDNMLGEGVAPGEIRGGLEVSGWLGAVHGMDVEEIRAWSNMEPASAVISLGPLPQFVARRSYQFPRIIGDNPGVVYDLRRVVR